MPTFDFRCDPCGHTFEESLPFGSKTKPPCPSCKGKKVTKLISPPSIVFKGSGFYKTDASASVASTKQSPPSETARAADAEKSAAPPAAASDTIVKSSTTKPEK